MVQTINKAKQEQPAQPLFDRQQVMLDWVAENRKNA